MGQLKLERRLPVIEKPFDPFTRPPATRDLAGKASCMIDAGKAGELAVRMSSLQKKAGIKKAIDSITPLSRKQ